jgi:hypothetical protein
MLTQFAAKTKKSSARIVKKTVRENPETAEFMCAELLAISRILLQVAQKYVPDTAGAYADAAILVQCATQLCVLDATTKAAANFNAAVVSTAPADLVVSSPEYRYLKNKAIAALATIADLGTDLKELPPNAAKDYQTGLRVGYARARKLAMEFLTDVHTGDYYESAKNS